MECIFNDMKTILQYLDAMETYEGEAIVLEISENDRLAVVLNQTILYPQGGGQPCDVGIITTRSAQFRVSEVRNIDGVVYHYGVYEMVGCPLAVGDIVQVRVDHEHRQLNSQIHSAGHVVDMGLLALGISWPSGKGYHFPAGPYVEYIGQISPEEISSLRTRLEEACLAIIADNYPCRISYDTASYRDGVPLRVVTFGNLGIPCGGTHVSSLNALTSFSIRKIKQDGERIRISYEVARA